MSAGCDYTPDDFPAGCLVTDARRTVLYANRYMEQQVSVRSGELVSSDLFTWMTGASRILYESYLVPMLLRDGRCDETLVNFQPRDGAPLPMVVSAWRDRSDGRVFWSLTAATLRQQMHGELTRAQNQLQQRVVQLKALSSSDPLTGLPNRVAMSRHIEQQIAITSARKGAFAVAYADLDGFKDINDRHGHHVGDQLLRLAARRMSRNLRSQDLVARFGGDEFVIFLQGEFRQQSIEDSLGRLTQLLSEPFQVDGLTLTVSASIGATLYPQAEEVDPDQLIRQADQAMYQAKTAGRNRVCLFNVNRARRLRERNEEQVAIRAGLETGQFELFYQPKVNMLTGDVLGVEALLRWHHPARGLTGPADFLPVVNASMLGVELGRWVVTTAVAQVAQWQRQGLDLSVSVNIDAYHLQHPDMLRELDRALKVHKVPPQRLELEVLETSTIDDIDRISAVLSACKAMGVRLSLDDFGTGYSTLGHLRDLSVDVLKIDRSFVKDMLTNKGDLAIILGVIGFARAFDCDVIAEGVETREHGQRLAELGCVSGQGYYIARPMPASAMERWLSHWKQKGFSAAFVPGIPAD